jgi:ribosomal-protein-alanine N-acetyltransferase
MLHTERLILRTHAQSDFDAVHQYASDPLVTRYTAFGPNTADETRAFLTRSIESATATPRRNYTFAAVERASGNLIGGCGLEQCDGTGLHYVFGYVFDRSRWRLGFGREAARALVQFAFEHLQAHRLCAQVFVGNAASVRILQRLAFRQEGLALQSLYLRNSWHDILTFAQLRSEWLAAGESGRN